MVKSKVKSRFLCEKCGNESPQWEGKCSFCGEWNTLVEFLQDNANPSNSRNWVGQRSLPPQKLSEISLQELSRFPLTSLEVSRVLGGGIVPGTVVLLSGDPGIGKSTLLLQMAADIAVSNGSSLYVTGEESMAQVKMRADRLGINVDNLLLLQTTVLAEIIDHLDRIKPSLAVVDSIQTVYDDSSSATPGSVTQVRDCTRVLIQWAKTNGVPIILTGHVTKGGDIAGPRLLEHMVDVVLYMEGESISSWRLLRAEKNRFGSSNEVGVFEMSNSGLIDISDPSKAFLSERKEGTLGSIVVPTLEGTRPILVEVQALTSQSTLPSPRRVATGLEFNRLLLICAVLSRRAGISLANQDIVVNVTGGLRLSEPAVDLGIALAIVSSLKNIPVKSNVAAFGEIGLNGEIRGVPHFGRRIEEASRLNLQGCLIPASSNIEKGHLQGFKTTTVETITQAMQVSFSK